MFWSGDMTFLTRNARCCWRSCGSPVSLALRSPLTISCSKWFCVSFAKFIYTWDSKCWVAAKASLFLRRMRPHSVRSSSVGWARRRMVPTCSWLLQQLSASARFSGGDMTAVQSCETSFLRGRSCPKPAPTVSSTGMSSSRCCLSSCHWHGNTNRIVLVTRGYVVGHNRSLLLYNESFSSCRVCFSLVEYCNKVIICVHFYHTHSIEYLVVINTTTALRRCKTVLSRCSVYS